MNGYVNRLATLLVLAIMFAAAVQRGAMEVALADGECSEHGNSAAAAMSNAVNVAGLETKVKQYRSSLCLPEVLRDSVPKIFDVVREVGKDAKYGCGDLDPSDGFVAGCEMGGYVCNVGGVLDGTGRRAVEIVEMNTILGSEDLQEFGCREPGTAVTQNGEPIVITVTVEDFARLPVEPLVPNAGPPNGWVPVNMVNVLYVEPEAQTLDVELLDTPVQVRATPISYHWDLGDGNTITTSKPGKPYPSEEVASEYTYEGWYDITLTTTFRGEFSVDGGEWLPIEGTIEVASDPVEIFAKSFESRLVDGDVPPDEEEDPWVPERSPETEGPQDPEARHREI